MDVSEDQRPFKLKGASKLFEERLQEQTSQTQGVPRFVTTIHRDDCTTCEEYATHNCSCKEPDGSNTFSLDWTCIPDGMATSHSPYWGWCHEWSPWQTFMVLRPIWWVNKEHQSTWGECLLWKSSLPQGRNQAVWAWSRAQKPPKKRLNHWGSTKALQCHMNGVNESLACCWVTTQQSLKETTETQSCNSQAPNQGNDPIPEYYSCRQWPRTYPTFDRIH